eukprot:579422-Prymnesium_polylepis.1
MHTRAYLRGPAFLRPQAGWGLGAGTGARRHAAPSKTKSTFAGATRRDDVRKYFERHRSGRNGSARADVRTSRCRPTSHPPRAARGGAARATTV